MNCGKLYKQINKINNGGGWGIDPYIGKIPDSKNEKTRDDIKIVDLFKDHVLSTN